MPNRSDEYRFKNRNRHLDPTPDNDIRVYGYNGQLWYRINNNQPKLIGGIINITQEVPTTPGGVLKYIRTSNFLATTPGTFNIIFSDTLGDVGTDYNVTVFATDSDNAKASYDQPKASQTKYGFTIITYDPNIYVEWQATLKTQ